MGLTKVGALWNGKPGSKAVFNGSVEIGGQKYKLLIFPNEDKSSEKQPDFRVCTDLDDVKQAVPYDPRDKKPTAPPPAAKPVTTDEDPLPF